MRKETRDSLVLMGGTVVTALLSLAYSIGAGRILGPREYADFAAAVAFVMTVQIALGPINGTVARFAAQFRSRNEEGKVWTLSKAVTRRVAWWGLAAALPALGGVAPLAKTLQFGSVVPLLLAYAMIYLTLLLSVPRGVLRGVQSFGQHSLNTVLEAVLRLTVGAMLLLWVGGAASGLAAYVVGLIAVLLLARFQLRPLWAGIEPQPIDATAVKRFTVPMLVMMATSAGFQHADMFFVKHYFPPAEAGAYGAAFNLARSMSVLVTPFTTLLLPLLTTLHEQRAPLTGAVLRMGGYFLLAAAGPMAALWLGSAPITTLLYGEEFRSAGPLLFPLAGARLLGYSAEMLALLGAATNRFGFLFVYLPCLAAEVVALVVWHHSLGTVVTVVLAVQGLTLVATAAFSLVIGHRRE